MKNLHINVATVMNVAIAITGVLATAGVLPHPTEITRTVGIIAATVASLAQVWHASNTTANAMAAKH